jgi:hypothetical protein
MAEHYVLSSSTVAACVRALLSLRIHRTFPGYLCLREGAVQAGRTDNLKPDFKSFFDRYLSADSGSSQYPYVVPFMDGGTRPWLNKNVAGSYAPSSLRNKSPLLQVADVFRSSGGRSFSLKSNHAELCVEHFFKGMKVPIVPLAVFIFRDFGFTPEADEKPNVASLVDVFRDTFGFRDSVPQEKLESSTLFDEDDFDQSVVQFTTTEAS